MRQRRALPALLAAALETAAAIAVVGAGRPPVTDAPLAVEPGPGTLAADPLAHDVPVGTALHCAALVIVAALLEADATLNRFNLRPGFSQPEARQGCGRRAGAEGLERLPPGPHAHQVPSERIKTSTVHRLLRLSDS